MRKKMLNRRNHHDMRDTINDIVLDWNEFCILCNITTDDSTINSMMREVADEIKYIEYEIPCTIGDGESDDINDSIGGHIYDGKRRLCLPHRYYDNTRKMYIYTDTLLKGHMSKFKFKNSDDIWSIDKVSKSIGELIIVITKDVG